MSTDHEQEHGQLSPMTILGYQAVFVAIANGRMHIAAQVLDSFTDCDLIELHVICQDVLTMIGADQRRRVSARRDHE